MMVVVVIVGIVDRPIDRYLRLIYSWIWHAVFISSWY